MNLTPVILEGHRVRLEPLSMRHLEGLAQFCTDEDIWRHMGFAQLTSPERLEAWIRAVMQEANHGKELAFAIVEQASGNICGSSSLYQIVARHKRLELGRTWLGQPFRGTGINLESKYLLLCHAFETLGCIRVDIKASLQNLRSQRAIERLGAVREGILRAYSIRQDDSISDIVMYSFIRSEWAQTRARLEEMLLEPDRKV